MPGSRRFRAPDKMIQYDTHPMPLEAGALLISNFIPPSRSGSTAASACRAP